MHATTPSGSRTTSDPPICSSNGNWLAMSTYEPMTIAGSPAWISWEKTIGIPTSPQIVCAMSSMRAFRPSWRRCRYFARSSTGVVLHAPKARRAAATAASTSSAVPSGTRPMTSSVVAFTTSMVSEPVEGTQAPSM